MIIFTTGGLLAGNRNTDGSFNNLSSNANIWSSLQSGSNAWKRNLNSGNATVNRNTNNKLNGFSVRCLKDWCLPFYSMNTFFERKLLYDLFQAYFDARKNKRNTINALSFEIDFERKLFEFYREIVEGRYKIRPSICFMIKKPMLREVFAADFRDRIVHHLIYNYTSPFFERLFVNDSYSCRIGKGTSYGINRLDHFIRSCSGNYKRDCYILKLDIKGYFMAIDKHILYQKVEKTLNRFRKKANFDVDLILRLIYQIIFYDPTKSCIIKGTRDDWNGLPKSKSLFYVGENKGLPIGNLTSQLFGNVYLNEFDQFIKYKLGCQYYGRYVDDIVIVHRDKEYLKSIVPLLKEYLNNEVFLKLHPKKIYLQHFSKGVRFLGAIIKPHRIYIGNQTKGNFFEKIHYWNKIFNEKRCEFLPETFRKFLASMNSYLGMIEHYNTYKLRKKMLIEYLLPHFCKYIYTTDDYDKIILRTNEI